jgi:hypothetical protein
MDTSKLSLSELLQEVDKLFLHKKTRKNLPDMYDYTLGKFPRGWSFNITNSWNKWMRAGLQDTFGLYDKPEYAVTAFLYYVKENKINVKKLMEKD